MAYLTQQQSSWMKPIYTTVDDQHLAEEQYQNDVFYFIHGQLVEFKTVINQLNLQSEIQKNLQDFIDKTPMIVQFSHFKTELYRPRDSPLSLKILQYILNSFDFLKMTHLIYDLSQFYLLLHQTYSQLIEQDEFHGMTLQKLYDQGEKYRQNEIKPHRTIIDNGIKAVNEYHQFADGLIRPGACDETQRFQTISFDTPIHYLVTTENHDEGDIIMRILSVLADFHNGVIDLLEKEMNNEQHQMNNVLKMLINELTTKTISIITIANDNTGVITLTEQDCLWIEQLSQSSLRNDDESYFLSTNSRLTFDFSFVQSKLIRTYLLLCRINYRHIAQKYQCYRKRRLTTTGIQAESLELDEKYLTRLTDEEVLSERMFLKEISLDKLYHAHGLIQQIALTLKDNPEDFSTTSLFDFVQKSDEDKHLDGKFNQYGMKDFQLCYINHILELYGELMNHFQYLFTDIPPLLQVPLDNALNDELIRSFDENLLGKDDHNDPEQIQSIIEKITELLDELKGIEDPLLQRFNHSFVETCQHLAIENTILTSIPNRIKCENYVSLNIHLIRIRSILQERKVNLEGKETKLWDENIRSIEQQQIQTNIFHQYLNSDNEETLITTEPAEWILPPIPIEDTKIEGEHSRIEDEHPKIEDEYPTEQTTYRTMMKLNLQLVPCTSSELIQQIHQYREQVLPAEIVLKMKPSKFTLTKEGTTILSAMTKIEKWFDRLKTLTDPNTSVIVDKNEIFVDLTNMEYYTTHPFALEYRVIDKQQLTSIQFTFREQTLQYLTTSKCQISTLIHRFIDDNHLRSATSDTKLCFLDEYGKCINDGLIADLISTNNSSISLSVTEKISNAKTFCGVTLQNDENRTSIFHGSSTWKQIHCWLRSLSSKIDLPADEFIFLNEEQQTILDENQSISSVFDQNEQVMIDIVDGHGMIKVMFTYKTNSHTIRALKSTKISLLLQNKDLQQQLDLVGLSSDHFVLALGETNAQILSKDDLEQSIGQYSTEQNQSSIHFRISILVQIIKYDDQEEIKVLLPDRDRTIEQLLQLSGQSTDHYKYLASNTTKRILQANEMISTLNEQTFILLRQNQTCLVSIQQSDEIKSQRFTLSASMMNIYKEYQLDQPQHYLLYNNHFIPSPATQLKYLRDSASSIELVVSDCHLPITVFIRLTETNEEVKFNSLSSITAERMREFACQLFDLNKEYYQLVMEDSTELDNDLSLEDIDENATEFRFQLTSTASMHCSIKYLMKYLCCRVIQRRCY